jgi:hypothetical protein
MCAPRILAVVVIGVPCLSVTGVLAGWLCRFLAVGGYDNTVRMLSLEDGTQLRAVATQAVNVSVCS